MATIYTEVELDRPADEVWAQVADVGGISNMLSIVDESSAEGDIRRCTLASGAEIEEQIISIDHDTRRVAYTLTKGLPFDYHAASMQVLPRGEGGCTLRWITDIKPDSEAERMGPMFEADLQRLAQ
jgi:hypothetical protein